MTNIPSAARDEILGSGIVSRIYQHETIDSTMLEAKRLIENEPEIAKNTLIISDKQESGHGRFQRKWFSPDGGLYFSLIIPGSLAPSFTLVAGLATAEAIERLFGNDIKLSWPNDVLLGGKKIAGILCETFDNFTILGIGVNTFEPGQLDPSLQDRARTIPLTPKSRYKLLVFILKHLAEHYVTFTKKGFEPFRNAYEKRLSLIGKEIALISGEESYQGIFRGVNEKGAIILDSGNEKRVVFSAEISAHDFKTKENN